MTLQLGYVRAWMYLWCTLSLILAFLLAQAYQWHYGSESLHTAMEVVATLLALFVGLVALVRYYSKRSNSILLIGVAFLGTTFLDGYHAIVTSPFFAIQFPSTADRLIPWSWSASRTFLAFMMILSWHAWWRKSRFCVERRVDAIAIYSGVGLLTLATFLFFAFVPLPHAYFPDLPVGRPQELVTSVLFLGALLGFVWKGQWKQDLLEHCIVLSLIVGVACQALFMPFSFRLFDGMFDTAHLLKILSYGLVLTGLFMDMYVLFVCAESATNEMRKMNSELKDALAAAHVASQSKSEFIANMSHEVRTPMTAIIGLTEELLQPDITETEKSNAIQTIQANGQHLLSIINDILDLSRIESGKFNVERVKFSIARMLSDLYSLMQVRAKVSNLDLRIECRGEIPETIESDPTRLRQVLVNLLGNAIKFTNSGTVTLAASLKQSDSGPLLQFEVIDTGIGMTADQAVRVFQPYCQADGSTSRMYGGTGLGLTICDRLVQLLGGQLSVDSVLGEGSRFYFHVPVGGLNGVNWITFTVGSLGLAEETPEQSEESKIGVRVLLAEDGPTNQLLIERILSRAGASVSTVDDGSMAVSAVLASESSEAPFDMILMDMQMPVMDGYQATEALRKHGFTGPIIALTAHAMAGDREKCIAAGCTDYATKPINRKELIAMVKSYTHSSNQ